MKLSALIESLSNIHQEHGDLDVYVGFANLGDEGRIEAELAEVEVEHYDPVTPADKGLMLWGDSGDLKVPSLIEQAREYVATGGPELLALALKHMRPTRNQDSDGDALMDIWQGWNNSLGISTCLSLSDLVPRKMTPDPDSASAQAGASSRTGD